MVKILIDNGHGVNTKGKQSPDGRLREYAFAREIAKRVESCLKCKGYDVERIVPEDFDISLLSRLGPPVKKKIQTRVIAVTIATTARPNFVGLLKDNVDLFCPGTGCKVSADDCGGTKAVDSCEKGALGATATSCVGACFSLAGAGVSVVGVGASFRSTTNSPFSRAS